MRQLGTGQWTGGHVFRVEDSQVAAIFGIGACLGLRIAGDPGLVFLILAVMATGYVGAGMILGSLLSSKQVGFAYTAILLPTIFSGTWFDLNFVGEGFQRAMNALPFAHALNATRAITAGGAGVSDIDADLLWVTGYSVALLALGVLAFRWRMTR